MHPIDESALRTIFLDARTHYAWQDKAIDDDTLRRLYDIARMGPTGGNSSPMRVVYVKSAEGKEKLKPTLAPGNVDKTMSAPVTAIVAFDTNFPEQMPKLFPARDMKTQLMSLPAEVREAMGVMGATLEGAYLIIAARALGLDCGPMGGFDKGKVDEAFLAGTGWKSVFLCNLGYGDASKMHPRNPRLDFGDAGRIV